MVRYRNLTMGDDDIFDDFNCKLINIMNACLIWERNDQLKCYEKNS